MNDDLADFDRLLPFQLEPDSFVVSGNAGPAGILFAIDGFLRREIVLRFGSACLSADREISRSFGCGNRDGEDFAHQEENDTERSRPHNEAAR